MQINRKCGLSCVNYLLISSLYINGFCTTQRGPTLVGCKHRASEGVFYIGGRGFVCQIIEQVTFAR